LLQPLLDSCVAFSWPPWLSCASAVPAVEARPAPMIAVVMTVVRKVDTLTPLIVGARSERRHAASVGRSDCAPTW
jgi:hypothetical protein